MFAPSFFTAWILTKIKPLTLMILGLAIDLVCVFTAVSGLSFVHFSVALILLGLGWNFLYVGGTQLLTESYAPNQKWLAQGLNDFGVTLALMVSSFTAGALVTGRGWHFLAQLAGAVATGLLLILLIYRFVQNKINTKQACCD
jgi:MFS family permease